jgi:ADP-ribose pyrophosphatase YjhB (NUDIX family)
MSAEQFRVIARAIILTPDRRIVLVSSQNGKALVPPGGAVDRGESLPQAAAREALEECGLVVTIGRAVWLREFIERKRGRVNLEVFFLAEPVTATLPDRWQHTDPDKPGLNRQVGLYSRQALASADKPVYPAELLNELWVGLAEGFEEAYLGRMEV